MKPCLARLTIALVLALLLPKIGASQQPPSALSIHFVTTEIRPDVKLCEELNSGVQIAYEPEPIITLADVESVALEQQGDNGPTSVVIHLSEAARVRLRELSAENVGRRLAIVVDDVAHSVPLIQRPLDVDRIPVGFYPDEDYARDLTTRIAAALGR